MVLAMMLIRIGMHHLGDDLLLVMTMVIWVMMHHLVDDLGLLHVATHHLLATTALIWDHLTTHAATLGLAHHHALALLLVALVWVALLLHAHHVTLLWIALLLHAHHGLL